jgi:hypothetical protein
MPPAKVGREPVDKQAETQAAVIRRTRECRQDLCEKIHKFSLKAHSQKLE